MGYKNALIKIACVCTLTVCCNTTTYAYTVKDMYADCGQTYNVTYPDNTLSIINSYIDKMLHRESSASVNVDTNGINLEITDLNKQLADCEASLYNGYGLSAKELQALTLKHQNLVSEINNLNTSLNADNTGTETTNQELSNVSKDEYMTALASKKAVDNSIKLTELNTLLYPCKTDFVIMSGDAVFDTSKGDSVVSPYNATVSAITSSNITISSLAGAITATLSNVTVKDVQIGSTLSAGSLIGTADGRVSVHFCINNKEVNAQDFWK